MKINNEASKISCVHCAKALGTIHVKSKGQLANISVQTGNSTRLVAEAEAGMRIMFEDQPNSRIVHLTERTDRSEAPIQGEVRDCPECEVALRRPTIDSPSRSPTPLTQPSRLRKKQKKAPNRGLMKKRGRPKKEEVEKVIAKKAQEAEQRKELEAQIEQKQREIERLRVENDSLRHLSFGAERGKFLLGTLKKLGVQINRTVLRKVLLLRSETVEEALEVVQLEHKMKNTFTSVRAARHQRGQVAHRVSPNDIYIDDGAHAQVILPREGHITIFGQPIIRCETKRMLFFANSQFDFTNCRVLCAMFDGKFSACPSGWSQSFELRLLVERIAPDNGFKPQQKTVTFAAGLLTGQNEATYAEVFKAARNSGCVEPPYLMTDFEIGISKAAREVWPQIGIRGCFFHFLANLRKRRSKVFRRLKQEPSHLAWNLLTVAPFLDGLAYFVSTAIFSLGLATPQLFENADFHLFMYVHDTYMIRLKSLFRADLHELLMRTNNSCEGRNSAVSKSHAKKLTRNEFFDEVEFRFKADIVSKWSEPPSPTPYDCFLQLLQIKSRRHSKEVLQFLSECPPIAASRSTELCHLLEKAVQGRPYQISLDRETQAARRLRDLSVEFRAHRRHKKQMRRQIALRFEQLAKQTETSKEDRNSLLGRFFLDVTQSNLLASSESSSSDSEADGLPNFVLDKEDDTEKVSEAELCEVSGQAGQQVHSELGSKELCEQVLAIFQRILAQSTAQSESQLPFREKMTGLDERSKID